MELANKIAFVTGGSHGLGSYVVSTLAERGAKVAFTFGKNREAADKLVNKLVDQGHEVLALQADASSYIQAESAVADALEQFGQVDILVNNVGGSGKNEGPIWTMSEQEWDQVIGLNLKACFNYTRVLCTHFMERRSGTIVNMGSINGLRGREGQPAYTAAKAGLVGFTKTVAKELGIYNVNVNLVATGYINTDKQNGGVKELAKRYMLNERAMKHLTEADEVASLIVFLCSPPAKYMTGSIVKMDAGEYI
jgi:3-oxoacyl-[acyl-carrier protein] reductase